MTYVLIKQYCGAINELELFSERPTFHLDPMWLLYDATQDTVATRVDPGEQSAYAHGTNAAKMAASWCTDGNTDQSHIKGVLKMLDDGDPEADDFLPRRPNLSGENVDEPTPQQLMIWIYGLCWEERDIIANRLEQVIEAWEQGVNDHFQLECERLLRNALNDENDICSTCGEERRALVHTDAELHPDDAVDGLTLHKFNEENES